MSLQTKTKKIHFIGIGGAGMSGLADILFEMGHKITGSDKEESETTKYLAKRGISVFKGHHSKNIEEQDLVVYSSAISRDNSEMTEAIKKNIPIIRRAEILGQLMQKQYGIAVSGTHGKTTTTSMMSKILIDARLDPTVVVGGKMQNLKTNARLGKGKYFLAEADEFDRSFLTLHPVISIITSLEEDHLDIYKDFADLRSTFLKFVNQTAFDGLVLLCGDHENVANLSSEISANSIIYGTMKNANIFAYNIKNDEGFTQFNLKVFDEDKGLVKINLPGYHNVLNALAAIGVALELEVDFELIKDALGSFNGVQRRFEFKAQRAGILFYDDYAHHPTEVKVTLETAKQGWDKRVVVLFQPHLFSRTADFFKEFAGALSVADLAIVTPIYPARESAMPGVTSQLITNEINKECVVIDDNNSIVETVQKLLNENDLFLTMGAGDIWKYGEQIIERMTN